MIRPRALHLFEQHEKSIHSRTDWLFAKLFLLEYFAGIVLAWLVSPVAWTGSQGQVHVHVIAAVVLGGILISFPLYLIKTHPGETRTRHVVAVSQMLIASLWIHLSGGRIETHFMIFGSLAFLAFYRDWRVLLSSSAIVAVDHILRGIYFPASVYGVVSSSSWRWMEHTAWVLFEDTFLFLAIRQSLAEMKSIANRATDAEEKEASLKKSESGFRAIFELAGSGKFVLCRTTGAILSANPKLSEYTGYSADEVVRLKLSDLIPPEEREERLAKFMKVASGELGEYHAEKRFLRKDGSSFWAIITGVNMLTLEGERPTLIATIQDITAQKKAELDLGEAKARAEEASEAKTAFLANMSHEIRTPLGAMLGFAQLMADDQSASAEQKAHLQTILRNGDQLFRVINDILDISKVEANKFEVEKIKFDLHDLIDDVIILLSLKAEEKGLHLAIHAVGPLPDTIESDPVRLKQILVNVIGNAIKFTAKGKVDVFFGLKLADGSTKLEIRVVDTGPGIPPEKVGKLFRPFTQADSATSRKFGGTGLGLYLSKRLSESLGGDLALENSDSGCTFSITIDAGDIGTRELFRTGRSQREHLIRADFRKPETNISGVDVLVVDDSPDNLQITRRFLEAAGGRVTCVDSAEAAIALLEKASFQVVLMDIQMPGLDGYEAVRKLRSELKYERPVLALTAHAMRGERERCLEAGFDGYLVKPIDRPALIAAVREHASQGEPSFSTKAES